MKLRASLALAALIAAPVFAHAEPTVAGFWERQDGDGKPTAWFLFSGKGDMFTGRLVKAFPKAGEDPPPSDLCTKCPGDRKDAHIMGLTMITGMKRDGFKYGEGRVLDPRNGDLWRAKMTLSEDGKDLEFRGYLGISLLGKSETWHRLPDDAMKKDEIPKEILATGPVEPEAHAAADKPKPKKPVKDKPKKAEPVEADTKPQ